MTAHFLKPSHHLTGKFLRYQALRNSKFYYVSLQPISIAECGGNTKFFPQDLNEPTKQARPEARAACATAQGPHVPGAPKLALL